MKTLLLLLFIAPVFCFGQDSSYVRISNISGTLKMIQYNSPGQSGKLTAAMLYLDKPSKLDYADHDDNWHVKNKVTNVQLNDVAQKFSLKKYNNKKVKVRCVLYEPETSYHIGQLIAQDIYSVKQL